MAKTKKTPSSQSSARATKQPSKKEKAIANGGRPKKGATSKKMTTTRAAAAKTAGRARAAPKKAQKPAKSKNSSETRKNAAVTAPDATTVGAANEVPTARVAVAPPPPEPRAQASGPPPGDVLPVQTELPVAQLKKIKSGLSKKDLEYFKQALLEKRAEIVGDVQNMEEARNSSVGGDISHMPLHMADIGSDNYEQELTLGLVESERQLVREIDEALFRIKDGIYGVCAVSGKPINKARLEIKPWAKYCVEVARERERLGL